MLRHTLAAIIAIPLLLSARALGAEGGAWFEGESPEATALHPSPWLQPVGTTEKSNLSAGGWLTRDAGPAGSQASWRFTAAGDLVLWMRRMESGASVRFRVDGGDWRDPDSRSGWDGMPLDISGDRYIAVAWQQLGRLTLAAGPHLLELEVGEGSVGIDCFTLLPATRRPYGIQRPDAPPLEVEAGWFAFQPPADEGEGEGESAIDLRSLNPKHGGDDGPITAQGDRLVAAKSGKPVRFWGVTVTPELGDMPDAALVAWATRLARRGVNLVRIHAASFYESSPGPRTRAVQRIAAACRKQGMSFSVNWYCLAGTKIPDGWAEQDGLKPGDTPFALHLFYPPMQAAYRSWAKTLLSAPGIDGEPPLGRDPALAMVELVDEDNFLFWTFDPANLPPAVRAVLEQRFGAWCVAKHGSIAATLAAWGSVGAPPKTPDSPDEQRLALYPAGLLGGADWMKQQRNSLRAADVLRFMIETERRFYDEMRAFLRDEVGYRGLLIGTNWVTVDERVAGPLEQYANCACDITAKNVYFGGRFKQARFFPWSVGDLYTDSSLLHDPAVGVTQMPQIEQRPHLLTEGGWENPNRFRTEEPLLMAAYASLQGIDGLCPFVCEGSWNSHLTMRWPISTPAGLGQYPAAALIYRLGYIAEGPVVARDALKLSDLYAFTGGAIGGPVHVDSMRAGQVQSQVEPDEALSGIDPMAFLVGRVVRAIGNDPGKSTRLPGLAKHIDRERSTVRSATGELTLRWDIGLLTIDAPRAQGVDGFLAKGGEVTTADARFALGNEYGAVALVSLDGKPLATSARMLLQVMTEQRNHGWKTESVKHSFGEGEPEVAAHRIVAIGGTPIEVREVQGTVSLLRADADRMTVSALDSGLRIIRRVGTAKRIELEPRTLAYLLTR